MNRLQAPGSSPFKTSLLKLFPTLPFDTSTEGWSRSKSHTELIHHSCVWKSPSNGKGNDRQHILHHIANRFIFFKRSQYYHGCYFTHYRQQTPKIQSLAIRDPEREKKKEWTNLLKSPLMLSIPHTHHFFSSISAHYSSYLFLAITSSEAPCHYVC